MADTVTVTVTETDDLVTVSVQDGAFNGMPAGGAFGEVLQKQSGTDYDVTWAVAGSGFVSPWESITAATATLSDSLSGRYLIDASANNIAITVPTAIAMGQTIEHTLKRIDDGGAYSVTVNVSGSDTFDGTAGDVSRLLAPRSSIKLGSDGVDKILLG